MLQVNVAISMLQNDDQCCGSIINVASLLLRGQSAAAVLSICHFLGESNADAAHARVAQPPSAVLDLQLAS
jgi:hypothetical protein